MLLPLDIFSEILKHIPYSEQGYLRLTCKSIYTLPLTFKQACSLPSMTECIAFAARLSEDDRDKFIVRIYSQASDTYDDIHLRYLKDFPEYEFIPDIRNFLFYRFLCKDRQFCQRVFPEINTDLNIIPRLVRTFNSIQSNQNLLLDELLCFFKDDIYNKIKAEVRQVFDKDLFDYVFHDYEHYDDGPPIPDDDKTIVPKLTEMISYITTLVSKLSANDFKTLEDLKVHLVPSTQQELEVFFQDFFQDKPD